MMKPSNMLSVAVFDNMTKLGKLTFDKQEVVAVLPVADEELLSWLYNRIVSVGIAATRIQAT